MTYKKIEKNGYHFHLLHTKKFKTVIIHMNFQVKLEKEKLTSYNLLAGVLCNSTKDYKTIRELTIKKEELYQCDLNYTVTSSLDFLLFQPKIKFIHEKYTEKGMNEKTIQFFLDAFFKPNVENNKFDSACFSLEKKDYSEFLEGKYDNPSSYATSKFQEILGEGTSLAYDRAGYIEDLDKITEASLYETYLDLISNSNKDIFIIGDVCEDIISYFDAYLKPSKRMEFPKKPANLKIKELKEIREVKNYQQSKLLFGYKIDSLTPFESLYVLPVFNYILGGDSDSLLFQNIREKNSLCYDIHSSITPIYSSFRIFAGIEKKDYEKTVALVKEQVEKMKRGKFLKKEIDKVKLNYLTSYNEMEDSAASILNNYESHIYRGYDFIFKRKKQIQKVDKEMVVKLANKISLVLIYFLEGQDEKEI